MKHRIVIGLLTLGIVAGALVVSWRLEAPEGAPTLGAPIVEPSTVSVGSTSLVTVTIAIKDPNYIEGSANILRVDSTGKTIAILGRLLDDGRNGDLAAGDRTFTGQVVLTEITSGEVRLRVSAAFRGLFKRVVSTTSVITARVEPRISSAQSERGDLSAKNNGYSVSLWWAREESASEYVVFRRQSGIDGAWEEIFRRPGSSTTGVDYNANAGVAAQCYRIEARNGGALVRQYEAVCVERFAR